MVDDALKFVPVTVKVKEFPPAVTEVGFIDDDVGTGLLIARVCALEVPPPGAELITVIEAVPAVAISDDGTVAVNWVDEAYVVTRAEPLKSTVDEATKLVPLTVNVNDAPPAKAVVGEIELVVGTGLFTTKAVEVADPPPGAEFVSTIVAVPVVAVLAAVSDIVNCVDEATVVALLTPLKVAVVLALKPVPVIVSVGEVLTSVDDGEIVMMVGTGLFIVKVCGEDVPPPGVGVTTVTEEVPAVAISPAGTTAVI